MKKVTQAMRIAHGIKSLFNSFKDALKAAWKIILNHTVSFVKIDTGEVRTANIQSFTTIEFKKGYAKFIEVLESGATQFRSCRLNTIIANI